MSLYEKDSIVALATPRGVGALSVIRVSGNSLSGLLLSLVGLKKMRSRYVYYKKIKSSSDGKILDHSLITFFKAPGSFTGEDVFEISCHGGDVVSKKIIQELIVLGCRHAAPGEFSKRAFLNGKIGLTEAESINNIIQSKSFLEAQNGLMSLEGKVRNYLIKIKKSLFFLLTIIEHELDFVEGEVSVLSEKTIKAHLQKALNLMQKIFRGSLVGHKIQTGFRVAIVGPPNAGKSSLFNAILGYDRAIISPEKGTTRDVVEAFLEIEGCPITLIDTAGHWKGESELDLLGIKKTIETINNSDIILAVHETDPQKFISFLKIKEKPIICVVSKTDIKKTSSLKNKGIGVSSLKDKNIDKLLTELSTKISSSFFKEDVFLSSERQLILLKKAEEVLFKVFNTFSKTDMVQKASLIRGVIEILQEIIGEVYSEEILNNIFKGFCVGK